MSTGEVIRRIRKSYGMTQRELATLMGYTQPVVSQLENNAPCVHDVRMLRRVARALRVPLAILVVDSDEEADMDRRNFLRASAVGAGTAAASGTFTPRAVAASPGSIRVGAGEVADIVASTNQIHELDLLVGGDRLCRVAANGVRYARHLLDNGTYTEAVGRSLTSAAAEMMTAAGWVHFDAGQTTQARRYYAEATQTATAAGDDIAAAHALLNASMISHGGGFAPSRHSADSRPQEGVNLATAASAAVRRHGGPRLRSYAANCEASAHAARGDTRATEDAIKRAHRAYESNHGDDPSWIYLPEAELAALTGWAYMRIRNHRKAREHLQVAVAGTTAWPRENAGWRIKLAENHILGGEIAEGCQLLIDHFDQINSVTSTRLRATLDSISDDIRQHSGVREVREFLGMRAARV
ncbi:helix-turn-helix domain-containing protein [Nocardia higoensis]|uniref:helix-turn-helix domain-containing protein n=1 Tax=Nocardia higoensis TaxID=228599 RepID=UPI0005929671|nr:helix-turn-helix transcriptional regulator [Nocardia higoensis]